LRKGCRALLYKGPDTDQEIAEAEKELKKLRIQAEVAMHYELPDALGTRTIVSLRLTPVTRSAERTPSAVPSGSRF
jgi:16S rRNA G527 N7-methylase RsmG